MNLVPVGELKPRDFFCVDGTRALKLDDGWYVFRNAVGGYTTSQLSPEWEVTPMPRDCDSFDWQPPREPTALELAKAWLQSGEAEAGRVYSKLREIIAAMELEAKQ